MGSIKRQGIGSGIFMYLGLFVGFANNILFPRFVGAEVLGFTIWVAEIAGFLILLSGFGGNISIIRFFPFFKDKAKSHNGYLAFLFVIRTIGLILTTLLIILLKDVIISIYDRPDSREYIEQYYPLLIAGLALLTYSDLLENYLAALMRPRMPTFFRDVFNRLIALGLLFAYYWGLISLEAFIIAYVCRFLAGVLGMILFTYVIGELHFKMDWRIFRKPIFKDIASFSFYSVFASLGSKFTTKIDILMIPSLIGMGATGIYGVFSFFASVITMPHNGIAKITSPILADAWKREDFPKIQELYTRTALNNFAAGMLIFVGIVINLDNIVHIIGEEFEVGKYVAVFLGLGQLAHTANGYNGIILNYSPKYRYDLAFKVGTAALNVLSNYILIKQFGITGAAMATALTILVINTLSQAFVYRHYRMHPFSMNMLGVIATGMACLLVNWWIPVIEYHFLVDLLARSTAITLLFFLILLGFRIAPDINDYLLEWVQKIRPGRKS
jgi:O-antigen/teichoic acid export membrane protein